MKWKVCGKLAFRTTLDNQFKVLQKRTKKHAVLASNVGVWETPAFFLSLTQFSGTVKTRTYVAHSAGILIHNFASLNRTKLYEIVAVCNSIFNCSSLAALFISPETGRQQKSHRNEIQKSKLIGGRCVDIMSSRDSLIALMCAGAVFELCLINVW